MIQLVNAAYKLEIGNTGVAFKTDDRYLGTDQVRNDVPYTWIFENESDGTMIGTCKIVVNENEDTVEIGPLAVKPALQVGLLYEMHIDVESVGFFIFRVKDMGGRS